MSRLDHRLCNGDGHLRIVREGSRRMVPRRFEVLDAVWTVLLMNLAERHELCGVPKSITNGESQDAAVHFVFHVGHVVALIEVA